MENYDPNAWYRYTDQNGNTFTARGDDPLIKESVTMGLPIYTTDSGEHYIYPFVERDGNSVTSHIPKWFKESKEYTEWQNVWVPTIPNTEINDYSVSLMNDVLGRLGREAAANRVSDATNVSIVSEKTTTATQETQQSQQDFWSQNVFQNYNVAIVTIGIAIIIAIAFGFVKSVKNKIKQRKEFSGIGWALLNAVVGLGLVGITAVVVAYSSIDKEIKQTKNKKYKKYAKRQMSDFVKTYAICFGIKLIIVIIINVMRYT